jgi:hypothetical protein
MEIKVANWLSILSLVSTLCLSGIGIYWQWHKMTKEFDQIGYDFSFNKSINVSDEEKMEIDLWLKDNNLNQYGDSKDTVYMGGNPLFDEKTGQTINRYDYILKKYPNRPWQKNRINTLIIPSDV